MVTAWNALMIENFHHGGKLILDWLRAFSKFNLKLRKAAASHFDPISYESIDKP